MSAAAGEARELSRARLGDKGAFERLVAPYRRELHVHCYRILGSVQDAEDMVQETFVAAWRGLDRFEERSTLRTWLYRVATNACLGMLRRSRAPRAIPPPPEPPGEFPPAAAAAIEPVWLEPYPDAWLDQLPAEEPGPEARYDSREAIELAFVTALQQLSARERAAVVLKDVLGYRSGETAEVLGTSEAAVNSALQRARAKLERAALARPLEGAPVAGSREERDLVGRFAGAFEAGDVDSVVALLSHDARLTMPPEGMRYVGPAEIHRFFSTVPAGGALERFKLVPTRANGQPAFGCYLRMPEGPLRAYGLMVLTLGGGRVTAITGFPDTSVFASFGLPRTLPDQRRHFALASESDLSGRGHRSANRLDRVRDLHAALADFPGELGQLSDVRDWLDRLLAELHPQRTLTSKDRDSLRSRLHELTPTVFASYTTVWHAFDAQRRHVPQFHL